MLTSIIGFPRVGNLRELKFATEKYFKHQISQERLQTVAKEIREKQWRLLKENGIDLIPSNDFSFYDTLLDSAALFNIIPSRYKELNLSDLDTYFAMSRGYQGDHGDVRALAMKNGLTRIITTWYLKLKMTQKSNLQVQNFLMNFMKLFI